MENNTVKNLSLLLELQEIDKQINKIFQVRGGLPQEVKKLEDDLSNLRLQATTYQEQITNLEENITSLRIKIKDIEAQVKRYEEQQMNVRNNREYDAITKEIELHNLDIQLAEKKIKESYEQIEKNKYALEALSKSIEKATQNFVTKQEDLDLITGESKGEEEKLTKKRQQVQANIDKPLLQMYEKIKSNIRNNLAVVSVTGGACGGCFTIIYPQMQAEIKEKRQIIKCEHCGRILADVADSVSAVAAEADSQID
jgi:predicted  nucleic acid-binding Zn-ribbon protein